jgi:hypothetical protein
MSLNSITIQVLSATVSGIGWEWLPVTVHTLHSDVKQTARQAAWYTNLVSHSETLRILPYPQRRLSNALYSWKDDIPMQDMRSPGISRSVQWQFFNDDVSGLTFYESIWNGYLFLRKCNALRRYQFGLEGQEDLAVACTGHTHTHTHTHTHMATQRTVVFYVLSGGRQPS